jgi:putative oxidoreductase
MNMALWMLQGVVAIGFLIAGMTKAFMPVEALAANMAWVDTVPAWLVRLIGIAEITGAVGLIVPAATRIKPVLTPIAAGGLAILLAMATGLHIARGELPNIGVTVVLLALLVALMWGRLRVEPIRPRARTHRGRARESLHEDPEHERREKRAPVH